MHEQHRERLRNKLLENSHLEEHEILEILLFYAIPRKNTNPIAHDLLTMFGSIRGVLKADPSMLMKVAGIGESTVAFLKTIDCIIDKYKSNESELPKIFSFEQAKDPIRKMFEGQSHEVFIAFFLDKKQKIIGKKIICDHVSNKVSIDLGELAKQVVAVQPTYVVISHNHLSGICTPTLSDDDATEKIMLMLRLHGVSLVDHIIITDNDAYSYYCNNRIDAIIKKVDSII